jgi:tRNA pseudouridine32 synthase / 23S rRNA pseudouridine746 synthase
MATSGLVVMARGIEAQRALSRAFEQRRVHKRYQALVAEHLPTRSPTTAGTPSTCRWRWTG